MPDNGLMPISAVDSARRLSPMTTASRPAAPSSRSPQAGDLPGSTGTATVASDTRSARTETNRQPAPLSGPPRAELPQTLRRPTPSTQARPPQPPPSSANVRMVLYDLQSGIRKAEALLQSVSTELGSSRYRLTVAKAYSLEMQAQQEINRLHTEIGAAGREWFA